MTQNAALSPNLAVLYDLRNSVFPNLLDIPHSMDGKLFNRTMSLQQLMHKQIGIPQNIWGVLNLKPSGSFIDNEARNLII